MDNGVHCPNVKQTQMSDSTISNAGATARRPESARLQQLAMQLQDRSSRISPAIVSGLYRLVEGLLFVATSVLVYVLYVRDFGPDLLIGYGALAIAATLSWSVLVNAAGLNSIAAILQPVGTLPRVLLLMAGIFAMIFAAVFFSKIGALFSRFWLGTWMIVGISSIILCRLWAASAVARWNADERFSRRAVLIGGGSLAADLISALSTSPQSDLKIVGIFDDRNDDRSPPVVDGYPKLGSIADLESFARSARVDMLIFTMPLRAEDRVLELAERLRILPVDIRLSANGQKLRFRPRAYSYIGNVPFLDIFDRPLSDWGQFVKSLEDIALATFVLVLAAPVMLLIAIAVKLESRGPVLFRQKRYGFNNELIEVYKFRSMYIERCDANASKLVTRDDPRVTRVGRFIRKTSLDELPQLFNVLKGQLSLVGPRPHATQAKAADELYDDAVDSYFARHRVKPGITGWAQINGWRGETDTLEKIQRRVEHDLYYIDNWSLFFDLYILARTPLSLVSSDRAY